MEVKYPATGKLNTRFTAMGPYFRKLQSSHETFFFDCLAECVNARVSADKREFYGWWLTLTKVDNCFEYDYWYGFYNDEGDWLEQSIPDSAVASVEESLQEFYVKLSNELDNLSIPLSPSAAIDTTKTLSAA